MAKINQALIERLKNRLGISKSRVYALIQQSANKNRVRRHIGALLLAGDNGISIQKYASAEDHAELRGIPNHVPVAVNAAPAVAPPPRAVLRKGNAAKIPKTKENNRVRRFWSAIRTRTVHRIVSQVPSPGRRIDRKCLYR